MENKLSTTQQFASAVLQSLIQVYQLFFSPLIGHNCRYLPSCSNYGIEAVELHGPVRGSWLAIKRVCRCHPWGSSGLDPVPSHDAKGLSSNLTPEHVSATMLSKG